MTFYKNLLTFIVMGMSTSLFSAIIVLRHGESTHNHYGFYNSNPNHSNYKFSFLTPAGINALKESCKQLLELGFNKDNITVSYVSPLPRTIQTAAFLIESGVISHDKIKIDNRLIEVQMGDREGGFYNAFPGDPWDLSPEKAAQYHGESFDDVRKRVTNLINDIAKENKAGHVLFITHGGPALQIIAALLNEQDVELSPAGFKVIELS